ncbi:MAG: hypothetical protein KAR38_08490, partial [Calditrichia bacterium]|nr:hypothetical protein [Calditrichia bacterium]
MKNLILIIIASLIVLTGCSVDETIAPEEIPVVLYINEFMASNDAASTDPDFNDYGDWIEIYNASTIEVNLSGYYLT